MTEHSDMRGPLDHKCAVEGCTDWGSFGFTFPDGTAKYACNDKAHRAAIEGEWEEARKAQAEAVAARMKPAQGALF